MIFNALVANNRLPLIMAHWAIVRTKRAKIEIFTDDITYRAGLVALLFMFKKKWENTFSSNLKSR